MPGKNESVADPKKSSLTRVTYETISRSNREEYLVDVSEKTRRTPRNDLNDLEMVKKRVVSIDLGFPTPTSLKASGVKV